MAAVLTISLLILKTVSAQSDIGDCSIGLSDEAFKLELFSDAFSILQLDLEIWDNSSLHSVAGDDQLVWYKPSRWYLLHDQHLSHILLMFNHYYGFFKHLLYVNTLNTKLELQQNPASCLESLSEKDKSGLIRSWMVNNIQALNNRSNNPVSEICTGFITNRNGFGEVQYKCFNVEKGVWYDVREDGWMLCLQIFIILLTIGIFLYFPTHIVQKYSSMYFQFSPKSSIPISVVRTHNPESYNGVIIQQDDFGKMKQLQESVLDIGPDTIYQTTVNQVHLYVPSRKILNTHDEAVNMSTLFNDFAKFVSGTSSDGCGGLDRTQTSKGPTKCFIGLNIIKTIAVYMFIAVPAIPLVYSLFTEDLESLQITDQLKSSNHIGPNWGKAIIGILVFLYILQVILHVFILITWNILPKEITRLMEFNITKNESPGQLSIIRLLKHQCPKFFNRTIRRVELSRSKDYLLLLLTVVIKIALPFTILSKYAIITIGINFLMQVLCIFVIDILINMSSMLSIVSLSLAILAYLWDISGRFKDKYNIFMDDLIAHVLLSKENEVTPELHKSSSQQVNTAFQYTQNDVEEDFENNDQCGIEEGNNQVVIGDDKHGNIQLTTRGIALFLDRFDVPYVPYNFFRNMTRVDCHGCPGRISASLWTSFIDLIRILIFLFFLLIMFMAFGDALNLSPSSQMFATLVTSVIPLALSSFFYSKAKCPRLDTQSIRFKNLFRENVVQFEKWNVADLKLSISNRIQGRRDVDLIIDDREMDPVTICSRSRASPANYKLSSRDEPSLVLV
ncbi:hypothetical protein SNE40_020473 [Patella caerulea]|uniref:Uncharacterized protein n=1 Tax=Patella caerulea TaxID=87958 RepID=A0AAN8G7L0_PATCE